MASPGGDVSASADAKLARCAWVLGLFVLPCSIACRDRAGASVEPEPEPQRGPGEPQGSEGDELTEICARSYELIIVPSGAGSAGVREDFVSRCRANAELRRQQLGETGWSTRVACIRAAEDAAALGRGDGREPTPPPRSDAAEELTPETVCRHFLEVMSREPELAKFMDEDEREMIMAGCVIERSARRTEDPRAYERETRCYLQAETIEQLAHCEP